MNIPVLDYIINNYILIIALIGLWIFTGTNVTLTKYMIRLLKECILAIFVLSIVKHIGNHLADLETLSPWRPFLKALEYSINPFLIIQAVRIICGIRKYKLLLVPALINMVISFSVFFSDIAFYYTPDNEFHRGTLGYSTYITSAFYMFVFFIMATGYFKGNTFTENIVIIFILVNALLGMSLRILYYMEDVYSLLFIVDIVFYFLFLHIQFAKTDSLTGLLNRQSYYNDIKKYDEIITGIIEIDMNELKQLNDNNGHLAGDEAIKAVSNCFVDNISGSSRVYRIGGDEFLILCIKQSEENIRQDVENIRKALSLTEYSCAIGMAYRKDNEDLKKIISIADKNMYEDKRRYHISQA